MLGTIALQGRYFQATLARAVANADLAVAALDALAIVGMPDRPKEAVDAVTKAFRSKEPEVRYAAARAFALYSPDTGASRLRRLMNDQQIEIGAAALNAVIAHPDEAYLRPLLGGASAAWIDDTIERRILAAIYAVIVKQVSL